MLRGLNFSPLMSLLLHGMELGFSVCRTQEVQKLAYCNLQSASKLLTMVAFVNAIRLVQFGVLCVNAFGHYLYMFSLM